MVSLGDYDNFSGNISEQLLEANDDRAASETALSANLDLPNNRVQTSAVIVFQVFMMIDLLVAAFLLPYFPDIPVPVFSLIVYLHCAVWALTFILDAYLRKQHALLSCYGFINFYQKTKTLRRTSLNIMSCGSILMLIISVVIADYCAQRSQCPPGLDSKVYLQMVIALETIILLPVYIYYLKLNHDFHSNKARPDIEPPNFITSIIQDQNGVEIGFRDNNAIEDTVEKQSDMIRYLTQYNTHLKQKLVRLSLEVQNSRRNDLVDY
ncbi:transmembrane protein 192 [Galendromus occidentalis]|uniref:Transmembrane protein 192 n=1 Tax=Galendromus occidentalis TaxID=34638 RepID=A0AAJ6QYJ3_9ACAR|nr:transmembrane protein 192 [Galendromus occidentalis]